MLRDDAFWYEKCILSISEEGQEGHLHLGRLNPHVMAKASGFQLKDSIQSFRASARRYPKVS